MNLSGDLENCSITLSGTTIKDNKEQGIRLNGKNGKLTMTGGTISNNERNGVDLSGDLENCSITLSGTATIKDNRDKGISLNGKNIELKMTGGTISNNERNGVDLSEDIDTCFITLSGTTTIKDNEEHGIRLRGKNIELEMAGGTISNNGDMGVGMSGELENSSITMSGTATIKDNKGHGIWLNGKHVKLEMAGGTITGNGSNKNDAGFGGNGITGHDDGEDNTITITGGTIRGNEGHGVSVHFKNSQLSITGGTIGGGNPPHYLGAVDVHGQLQHYGTITNEILAGQALKAATDANRNVINQEGPWD